MELKKREDVKITAWLANEIIANPNWEIFGGIENDEIIIITEDPETKKQLKIKIEKKN